MSRVTRAIVLWCPDWPVTATMQEHGIAADAPVALVDRNLVFACSAAARSEGVQRGLRLREAQFRCTGLEVFPYDPVLDARAFEPVLAAIEEIMPGVQLVRPGTCAIRARGPSRYYGGEEQAAAALLRCLGDLGIAGARVGIADGPFAAEQAARSTRGGSGAVRIVPAGDSPRFLAPLPIGLLGQSALAALLRRLGINTLGDFAALGATDVRERFGEAGARAHVLAGGRDGAMVVPRIPPKQLDSSASFEPPLDRIDQVTFAFRAAADAFIAGLTRAGLVCTAIRIEVETESGQTSERSWQHPRLFTAADVVDRVRWQLQGSGSIESGLTSAITRVRVEPESVDDIGHHEVGLWGGGADERIHHGLSRVQSMLGHDAVLTATIGGGRVLAERQVLVPWGDRAIAAKAGARPWPGSLPAPAPSTVFEVPRSVAVLSATDEPVDVDERGEITGPIELFSPTASRSDLQPVAAWAGPWPIRERWWDAAQSRSLNRFQVVDASGTAWLLMLDEHRWWAEGRYD
ncbi:MAG: polymerase family protein [Leifsonia sp.]|jgi:protein ImuB|nr:polymerase family protein [Leifsonia sp.]